jgi:serine/threonine protein kinase/tetratricopeptide (TPR) repeat protein
MSEREIFIAALHVKDRAARSSFLDEACGDDRALRECVEQLLSEQEELGSFLEYPAEAVPGTGPVTRTPTEEVAASVDGPGSVIGPYKLIQEIGEGGMGTVYMARQTEPVKRLVALKLIKLGMDSKQVLARFDAERQALALMDHPNIAKVLDAGTTGQIADCRLQIADSKSEISNLQSAIGTGRPYFVMELVKGVPITKFCDQHRLTPRQRLELFVPVCHAIQHAHQKGIIHRDIKPSNVLVALYDDRPVPKVIDFGVAKATGQQLAELSPNTAFGAVVGTLEYMSPEQASFNQLDIDTRSDIYSLGVLLYELLAGSPPFSRKEHEQAGMLEMLRVIREQEPSKPSTKLSTADGLPTLAANRSTEPAKLTRLMRGELDWIVMKALEKDRARRYETANGLAMDLQRYLADETVLACPPSAWYRLRKFVRRNRRPVLAITITFLVLLVGIFGTTWGMVRAEAARAASQKRLEQLERGNQILASIFRGLDPNAEEREGKPLQAILGERLDAAVEQLKGESIGDPLTVARLQGTLGASLAGLGYPEKSIGLFTEADETFTTILGGENSESLSNRNDLANSLREVGRLPESVKLHEETLALQRAVLGPDHPSTLISMNNLANSYAMLGRREEALKMRQETLDRRRVVLGPDHPYTLVTMQNLANSYESFARTEDACKLREETLALQRVKLGPANHDTLLGMNNLANSYEALGRYADSLKLREEVLALRRGKLGPRHPETLLSMGNLANSLYYLGHYADARNLYEQTLPLLRGRLGNDHPYTLNCMNGLAAAYTDLGQHAQAFKLLKEVWELRKAKIGPRNPETLASMINLIAGYAALHQDADALKLCEETLPIMKSELGPDHPYTLLCMHNMANSLATLGRPADAVNLDEQTFALMKAKFGPDHPHTLKCMHDLATNYDALHRHKDALALREQTLELRKAKLGINHPATLASMNALAVSYVTLNRHADALKIRLEMLAINKAKLGPDHPDTLEAMNSVAVRYYALGKYMEAKNVNEETLALRTAKLGPDDPATLMSRHNLGNCYDCLGRHADALNFHQETLRLRKAKLGLNHPYTLLSMWANVWSLVQLNRAAEAVPIIDDCVERARGQAVEPNLFQSLMELRLRHFQKARDAAGCRETATKWENLKRTDAVSFYHAARMRAVTAWVIRAADQSDASLKEAAAEADQAMASLNKAVAAGYKNAAQLKSEKDLDSLRDRLDYQKLVAELEKKSKE